MKLRKLIYTKHPLLFASMGLVSMVVSHVVTAKCAIKYKEKKDALPNDISLKEEIKLGVPCYAPAIMATIITGGLLVAGIHGYAKASAGAMAAYAYVSQKFKNYIAATEQVATTEQLNEINDIVKEKDKNLDYNDPAYCTSPATIIIEDDYMCDKPRRTEITYDEFLNARYSLNRELINFDEVCINLLYSALGFDCTLNHESLGWNTEYLIATEDIPWIDLDLEEKKDEPGVYKLIFYTQPIMGYRIYTRYH